MKSNNSNSGQGCLYWIILILVVGAYKTCTKPKKQIVIDSTPVYSTYDSPRKNEPLIDNAHKEIIRERVESLFYNSQLDKQVEKYKDIRLADGKHPYKNQKHLKGSESRITVKTATGSSDNVIIVKQEDKMVQNTYVRAGRTTSIAIPNGTYQVFFYSGEGWDASKKMPNGQKGGFVMNESVMKDDPQSVIDEELVYELALRFNGNFQTKQSSKEEAF